MGSSHILVIDDDWRDMRSLFHAVEDRGFIIHGATCAADGFHRVMYSQHTYDLICVDIAIPLANDAFGLPEEVYSWYQERWPSLGLLKWLALEMRIACPILVMSVVSNPIAALGLGSLRLAGAIPKRGLTPARFQDVVLQVLEQQDKVQPAT